MDSAHKLFLELKELLKSKAVVIKQAKIALKNAAKAGESYGAFQYKVLEEKREFRHHLIAYCEMKGMARERIEKPAENNLPNEAYIAKIKEQYTPKLEEVTNEK
jgi:hypothetical protein